MKLYIMTLTNNATGKIDHIASSDAPLTPDLIVPPAGSFKIEEFEITSDSFIRGKELLNNVLEVVGNRVQLKTGMTNLVLNNRKPEMVRTF